MAACCKKNNNKTHQTGRWQTELMSFILLKSSLIQSSYLSDESRKPISLLYKLLTLLFSVIWRPCLLLILVRTYWHVTYSKDTHNLQHIQIHLTCTFDLYFSYSDPPRAADDIHINGQHLNIQDSNAHWTEVVLLCLKFKINILHPVLVDAKWHAREATCSTPGWTTAEK